MLKDVEWISKTEGAGLKGLRENGHCDGRSTLSKVAGVASNHWFVKGAVAYSSIRLRPADAIEQQVAPLRAAPDFLSGLV